MKDLSMSLDEEFKKYFCKLNKLQEFMICDLRRSSIDAHANFLVAMGTFNYIEILGSFYKYKEKYKVNGKNQKGIPRFDFAINELFNASYKRVFAKIKIMFGKPPYDMFRSGMSHEYLVKTYKGQTGNTLYFSVINPNGKQEYDKMVLDLDCGIRLLRDNMNKRTYVIEILCPKLVEDFNLAIEEYKKRLLQDIGAYRVHFIRRATEINLDLMN